MRDGLRRDRYRQFFRAGDAHFRQRRDDVQQSQPFDLHRGPQLQIRRLRWLVMMGAWPRQLVRIPLVHRLRQPRVRHAIRAAPWLLCQGVEENDPQSREIHFMEDRYGYVERVRKYKARAKHAACRHFSAYVVDIRSTLAHGPAFQC